jgi:replicative DNA helicase
MCSKDKKIAGALLAGVDESYFHSPESVELYQVINRIMADTGESPSYRLLIEDPDLSKEARDHMRESQATAVTTTAEAKKAVSNLEKYRKRRGVYNLAVDLSNQLKAPKVDIDGLLHRATSAISVIRAKKATDESFLHFGKNNNSMKTVDSILYDDNSVDVIPTGIESFDSVSGGVYRGALFTIGANSGGGKSIMATVLAKNFASQGYKVVLVPLEMSKKEMTTRLMASVCGVDFSDLWLQRLATGDRDRIRKKFRKWLKKVKQAGGRLTIYKPEQDETIEEVFAATAAYEADINIIDYIGLLKGVDGDDQVRALGQVARYGKINAENTGRANIMLSQLTDDGKIKYSRAIAEHSSLAWTWMATPESKETGVTRIEQPKSRNSMAFPFYVKIDYAKMQIHSMDMSAADEDSSLGSIDVSAKDGKKKRKDTLQNLASDV